MKKVLKVFLLVIVAVVVAVGIYAGYVFASWHRIDDRQALDVSEGAKTAQVPAGKELKAITYNIGFGAYLQDFSFFMDGGTQSRAKSRESVESNMKNIAEFLTKENPDICLVQEVDRHSTRSHQVDEVEAITGAEEFANFDSTYAVNYDSPYLFYPVRKPHGKNYSGIVTLSRYEMTDAVRRSLPVQDSLARLIDLDRCYSKNVLKTSNGRQLVVYDFHLSAYTTDKTVANRQLKMLYDDMQGEHDKGNYIIAGGDFNKDLLGDSGAVYGISGKDYSWCQPFVTKDLPDYMRLISGFDEKDPVPSCRNCNEPWNKKTTFQANMDGFLVSDNVEVKDAGVYDLDFMYSDHNPVYMNVILK